MSKTNTVRVLIATLDVGAARKIAQIFKRATHAKLIEEFVPGDYKITMAVNKTQVEKLVNDLGYSLIIASPEAINELWPSFLAKFAGGAIIYPAVPKGQTVSESIKKIAHNGKVLEY